MALSRLFRSPKTLAWVALAVAGCSDNAPAEGGEQTSDAGVASDATPPPTGDASTALPPPSPTGPVVRAVLPNRASLKGGEVIRIEGVRLGAEATVKFGTTAATVTEATDTALVVKAPAAMAGGAVPIEVTTPQGKTVHPGFRYYGIAATALRFVEVPGAADAAPGSRVFALRTPTAPRVAVVGPDGISVLEPGAQSHLTVRSQSDAPPDVRAACAADFDGNGIDDIFLADASGTAGVHRSDGTGLTAPAPLAGIQASEALCGDFDGDGHADVLAVLSPPEGMAALQLLVGDGRGGLAPSAVGRSLGSGQVIGLAAFDFDGDGHSDALVGRTEAAPRLLLGDGGGGFADAPPGTLPAGGEGARPLVADFDSDGKNDVFLLGPDGAALWLDDGQGHLADHSGLSVGIPGVLPTQLEVLDVDLDGAPDVMAVGAERTLLLRNDGTGRLFDYSDALLARGGESVLIAAAVVDLDGDHDPELIGLRADHEKPAVFRNWDPLPFVDPDADGLPNELDNCPEVPNPDQLNRDAVHFGCATAESCLADTGCVLANDPATNRDYLSCAGQARNPTDARAFCTERGSQLLFPDNPAEQVFVAGLAPGHVWLDLSDGVTEGTFIAADGRSPTFAGWSAGQPDDAGGNEDCVELIGDDPAAPVWNDLPCDASSGWVCELGPLNGGADPADACDNCPGVYNFDQVDRDLDGVGDACDPCVDMAGMSGGCP